MRGSPEIFWVKCTDLGGEVFIVTKGFIRGQLRGSYKGGNKDIIIPLSITVTDPGPPKDITVTSIYQNVFRDKKLKSVTFPVGSEFTRIHARAFQKNDLATIKFPASLNTIEQYAFAENKIEDVTIGEGVTIGDWAFADNDITKITIGANVTIGVGAFGNNKPDMFRTAYYEAETGGAGIYNFDKKTGDWEKE